MWAHCGGDVKLPGFYGFHAPHAVPCGHFPWGVEMRLLFLAIAFMLAGAGQCPADESDIRAGEQLLANCQSNKPRETWSCRNYVAGATETILLIQAQTFVCYFLSPDGFTEEQAIGAVVDYLKAHPEEGSMSGAKAVMDGLAAKYPCPQ